MPKKQTPRAATQAELRAITRQINAEKAAAEKAVRKIQSDKARELTRIDKLIAQAAKKSVAVIKRCDAAAARLARTHAIKNRSLHNRLAILEARLHA